MLIDPNITYSPQFCDHAVGIIIGEALIGIWILRLGMIILGFYAVYELFRFLNKTREGFFGNGKRKR